MPVCLTCVLSCAFFFIPYYRVRLMLYSTRHAVCMCFASVSSCVARGAISNRFSLFSFFFSFNFVLSRDFASVTFFDRSCARSSILVLVPFCSLSQTAQYTEYLASGPGKDGRKDASMGEETRWP